MHDTPEPLPIPSGVDTIRDQITRLVAAIQQPDEPCAVHAGQIYVWLPGVVSALDIPYLELPEDDQVAFMEALDVGHWQAPAIGDEDPQDWLMVPLKTVLGDLVYRGRSAHARAYVEWLKTDFFPSMLEHGCYDPATNHAPPIGKELDTLEVRERCRGMVEHFLAHLHDSLGEDTYGRFD